MPLHIVTVALDTDQPENSRVISTPLTQQTDALVLATALAELQAQYLRLAATPPPGHAGAGEPTTESLPIAAPEKAEIR